MSDNDTRNQLDFFNIGDDDWSRLPSILQAVKAYAPSALDAFYDKISATPQTASFFSSRSQMMHAKQKQIEHWTYLFSNRVDSTYLAKAQTIGNIHARIGLEPKWYIGGYARVLDQVVRAVLRDAQVPAAVPAKRGIFGRAPEIAVEAGPDLDALSGVIGSFIKLALHDMLLSLSAYFVAEEEKRNKVIEQLADALTSLSNGDFRNELSGMPEDFHRIETDFEHMRHRINDALGAVANTSLSINTGASEIRQASADLARRTEQQAASLEETAAALDQLTSGVRESAEGAATARGAVEQTQSEAENGGSVLREAVGAMDDIQRSTQEIGKIIGVIDGIAFQTNLLALNAGVEAARAGDAGKGFAVVANEVRALAQRSAEAANDIKSLIKSSTDQVEKGVSLVGRSGEAFGKISTKVAEVAGMVSNIADLSQRQAQGLHQINGAVRDMDQMTQQNAAMVEESAAASRSLASEAQRLQEMVGHFQLSAEVSLAAPATAAAPRAIRAMPAPVRAAPRTQGALALKEEPATSDDWSEF